MKTPYKNILSVLRLNRFIVLIVVICCFLFSGYCVLMIQKLQQKTINSAFVVSTEGDVIPLTYQDVRDNLLVEIEHHLLLFHTYFYEIDGANYESQIEKALWLGAQSLIKVFEETKARGHYNNLIQYSTRQEIIEVQSKIDANGPVHSFETKVLFDVVNGDNRKRYLRTTTGVIVSEGIKRSFPYNPHGLLISRFFEKEIIVYEED